MLPGNYNTTVVQPVSALSANQIGPEKGEEEEEEERDKKRVENKAKLIHPEKKKKQGGQKTGRTHFTHPGRVAAGEEEQEGEGLHSFLSDDAETDEGVRTGQRGDRRCHYSKG